MLIGNNINPTYHLNSSIYHSNNTQCSKNNVEYVPVYSFTTYNEMAKEEIHDLKNTIRTRI